MEREEAKQEDIACLAKAHGLKVKQYDHNGQSGHLLLAPDIFPWDDKRNSAGSYIGVDDIPEQKVAELFEYIAQRYKDRAEVLHKTV